MVEVWGKHWGKRASGFSVRPRRRGGGPVASGKRQVRQSFHGTRHVEQARVRVNVHRQADVAMSHGGLRGSWFYPGFGKVSPEARSQGVNVNRPVPVVTFRDSGGEQVPVENPQQAGGNVEN